MRAPTVHWQNRHFEDVMRCGQVRSLVRMS